LNNKKNVPVHFSKSNAIRRAKALDKPVYPLALPVLSCWRSPTGQRRAVACDGFRIGHLEFLGLDIGKADYDIIFLAIGIF